ncbi:MAG: bifunctional alpha/beta hydrolase/class I SAM-dependent methyltransferase [Burkholderiales bacterium]|nr:bifunctional alpha/beta hydrolase/class I SAM-dependent methyltransferase [Burkholderiales bacterium]
MTHTPHPPCRAPSPRKRGEGWGEGRSAHEHTFRTHDGVELFYRHWPAPEGPARGAIVLFHRGHEHSGRMAHLADELGLADFDFFAWDARGHGRSPGARGDAPGIAALVRDVQTFLDHIGETHGFRAEDIAVVAQSVGAVLVAAWVHDYAPRLRCMVLASPAFKVKLYVPFARAGLALMYRLRGNFFVTSYVKAKFLTRDPERMASYDSDPLIARAISVRVLLGLYDVSERIVADAAAIVVPTQLLLSSDDWVVHHGPQHGFFDRLGACVKERHLLAGFYHDTLGERDRAPALARVRSFLLRRFAVAPAIPDVTDADQGGFTREESDALAAPLSPWSLRGMYWRVTRAGLALGARLSDGVRLGRETGFDSGSTLDYVYRDVASGVGPLGRLIDRNYLDAIGWTGIRQRKRHLEELLRIAIADRRTAGAPVRIVDIAGGHGRYVLDAIAAEAQPPESILMRDYSDRNVGEGRALIAARNYGGFARFEKGNAFDRASLARIAPRPTIGIVSGLYELFPDNAQVAHSLAGLADAIEEGGLLVYTGQPWHPQLELIARGLTSHRGGAWVMRRRTQVELDQLVEAAGFRKIATRVDEWGIFTVSLARRQEK